MARLNQSEFARRAGVTPQAVSKALRAGHLIAGPDGRLDPAARPNRHWLGLHQNGWNSRGQLKHGGRAAPVRISRKLQREVDELLAECRRDNERWLAEYLAETRARHGDG